MARSPATPGSVPAARMPIDDAALDIFISTADAARAGSGAIHRDEAELFLHAAPALLRELRHHRRTAALPSVPLSAPANLIVAPLRVS